MTIHEQTKMNPNLSLSEIQIIPVKPRDGLVAFCSFVLNGVFYIGDVRIVTRLDEPGYRLSYPFKILGTTGKKLHICHPLNSETEQFISKQVIAKYEELLEQGNRHNTWKAT